MTSTKTFSSDATMHRSATLFPSAKTPLPTDLLWDALLDTIPVGIVTLNTNLFLLRRNAAAARLLDEEDGLHLYQGQLRASTAHHSFLLMSAVRHLEKLAREQAPQYPVTMLRVPRKFAERALEIVLKRVPNADNHEDATAVIVYMCDPERRALKPEQLLANLYNLTPAETQLTVHLMHGHSLEAAAEILRVKKDTVRKHLQAVFSKTQTSRQSDLIRLLMGGIAQLVF